MKVLMLAPHPFYQDRGTPIAVHLMLKVLSERGDAVDVLTYAQGQRLVYEGVSIFRIPKIPFIHGLRPGFSWKKVICDFVMLLKAVGLALRRRYDLVHAVEESVFMALLLKVLFKIPYLYDMDSSLVEQMVERYSWLTFFKKGLDAMEAVAVQKAYAVMPVCEALATQIQKYKPRKMCVLQDVSLLKENALGCVSNLRKDFSLSGLVVMYVGNFEPYQGIGLLLKSFARVLREVQGVDLVLIGGESSDLEKYRNQVGCLGMREKVHFLGHQPVEHLADYLAQADILVSPRLKGNNTPMKIYSYLHSAKPIVATNLPTHTQVLNERVAVLGAPTPEDFSKGLLDLIQNESLRLELGKAGKKLVEENYSEEKFREKLMKFYDELEKELCEK